MRPDWSNQAYPQLMINLKLPVVIAYVGDAMNEYFCPFENLLGDVVDWNGRFIEGSFKVNKPTLFYNWIPQLIVSDGSYLPINFPPYSSSQ